MGKNLKRGLIVIAILLLIGGGVYGVNYFAGQRDFVASNPSYINELAQNETLEVITDEVVPLAGPQDVQVVPLVIEEEPATPPSATPTPVPPVVTQAPSATEAPATPTPTPTSAPTPTVSPELSASPSPSASPTPTPAPVSNTATRLLERANTLLTQFNACASNEEKRTLLGITNSNFSNDSFRAKLLYDLGGSWEQLEDEVVDATQYQQDKTLYVQVYMSGLRHDMVPVVYTTQYSDLSGNQWSTNLVYNDDIDLWMEYTQKHPYNDSRVGYGMTALGNNEDGWDELKDVMETSSAWEEVVVPTSPDPVDP